MIGIGIAGCGYWGSNLIRNFTSLEHARLRGVCDLSPERLEGALQKAPGVETYSRFHDLIHDPKIEAIVVATPAGTHFPIAMESLQAGKHVLVAKPLATSSEEAMELHEEASKRGLTLMVGHTFVYSGAVQRIRQIMSDDDFGEMLYYSSSRANLGVFQPDVNVLWDLAVHDLSILDFLLDDHPVAISATGTRHLQDHPDNLAVLTLFYPDSRIAHIHVSWVAPVKVRHIHIGGSRQMIVYDDTRSDKKVTVHNKGVVLEEPVNGDPQAVRYRDGGWTAPELDSTEPLFAEATHFVDCIQRSQQPLTGAPSGLRIVTALEAATRSMEQRGQVIELPSFDAASEAVQLAARLA
ncbi:MAG: Gfo/Idh/MocA family oxidoreductase [Acidobacteriota bacterium]